MMFTSRYCSEAGTVQAALRRSYNTPVVPGTVQLNHLLIPYIGTF